MKTADIQHFQNVVWAFYDSHGRHDLPWRKTCDPYHILVSEIMLQQTQVDRVIPKYLAFLKRFPNIQSLAKAPLADVLALWSGLGYNRRALYLKRAAEAVVQDFGGKIPQDAEMLETLPGIGPYTARAVATFSFGASYIFIETNIRRVFISRFFAGREKVPDSELLPYIRQSQPDDLRLVKKWYWALMDYGSYLKSSVRNPNRQSAHYIKQSTFTGSVREVRGAILRRFAQMGPGARLAPPRLLAPYKGVDQARAQKALTGLIQDGFLDLKARGYVTIKK